MKTLIILSAPLWISLLYFFVVQPVVEKNRYEGIVVKSYDREGKVFSEMIYVLDKQTGTRKRDWER